MAVHIQKKWRAFAKDRKRSRLDVLKAMCGANPALEAHEIPLLTLSSENAGPQTAGINLTVKRFCSEDSMLKSKLHRKLGTQQTMKSGNDTVLTILILKAQKLQGYWLKVFLVLLLTPKCNYLSGRATLQHNPPSSAAAILGENHVQATGGPLNIANFAMRAASEGIGIDFKSPKLKLHHTTSNSSLHRLTATPHEVLVQADITPKSPFKNANQSQR